MWKVMQLYYLEILCGGNADTLCTAKARNVCTALKVGDILDERKQTCSFIHMNAYSSLD